MSAMQYLHIDARVFERFLGPLLAPYNEHQKGILLHAAKIGSIKCNALSELIDRSQWLQILHCYYIMSLQAVVDNVLPYDCDLRHVINNIIQFRVIAVSVERAFKTRPRLVGAMPGGTKAYKENLRIFMYDKDRLASILAEYPGINQMELSQKLIELWREERAPYQTTTPSLMTRSTTQQPLASSSASSSNAEVATERQRTPRRQRTHRTSSGVYVKTQTGVVCPDPDSEGACTICFVYWSDTLIRGCGHNVMCSECAAKIVSGNCICPICRGPIDHIETLSHFFVSSIHKASIPLS